MKPGVDYIKLNDAQLKQLQQEMLPLLQEVHRICEKHNISYFLSDGTLLGAIRHKGFIPWDDDIDIQMFREEYERFCKICESELDTTKFYFQNQETDKNYNWVYGKLRLNNTSYVRAGQEHIKQKDGIFLDIFPIDKITDRKSKQRFSLFMCKICRKILWAQVGRKSIRHGYSKLLYTLLSYIPRKLTITIFEFFAKLDNKKDTSLLVSHNLSAQVFKREWYMETIKVEFEGLSFHAPKRYDEILSYVYGEYMKLPPIDKRQGHCYASYIKFLDGSELKL